MNIQNLVQDTFKDIDDNQKPLSTIFNKCLRISQIFNDIDELVWIEINLKDVENLYENSEFKNNLYFKLLSKYGHEVGIEHWNKIIKNYVNIRL